ncbi:TAXI family TRAP transporter solute-binding subunit [Halalkalicoccus salilacus]|uniref:TAXI family TRAP transporter solute-binding subunit n=1 Tax=Halalkalicoccus salilacus TaxID=3117459 RepID=UPI00300F413E
MAHEATVNNSRRTYLKAASAVCAMGVAGCLGGNSGSSNGESNSSSGGSNDNTLLLTTASEATANFAMMQGVGTVINENSDKVRLDVRPSEGMATNIGTLARGEADLGLVTNSLAYQLQEGMEPFGDVDLEIRQIVHTASSDHFFISHEGQFSSLDEIQPDTPMSPAPSGTSIREYLDHALNTLNVQYESRSIGFGEQGNALQEGQIDVGFASFMNSVIEPTEPGWVQQIKGATTPDILEIPDDMWSTLQEDPMMATLELDHDPNGYGQVPSPIRLLPQATYVVGTDSVSDDLIYDMLKTQYENRDKLSEYHDLARYYEVDDHWTSHAFDGTAFHGSAADFYEENGMWEDNFERP